jgi:hypothetical protein
MDVRVGAVGFSKGEERVKYDGSAFEVELHTRMRRHAFTYFSIVRLNADYKKQLSTPQRERECE